MLDMITPNFSRAEMSCRCGCGLDHMDEQFMKMLQQLRNQLGPLPVSPESAAKSTTIIPEDTRNLLTFSRKELIFGFLDRGY